VVDLYDMWFKTIIQHNIESKQIKAHITGVVFTLATFIKMLHKRQD